MTQHHWENEHQWWRAWCLEWAFIGIAHGLDQAAIALHGWRAVTLCRRPVKFQVVVCDDTECTEH